MKPMTKLFIYIAATATLSTQLQAESHMRNEVGLRAGVVDVKDLGSTSTIGVVGDLKLTDSFSFRPSVDYWQKSVTEDIGFAEVEATITDITLAGALKYSFTLPGSAVEPYVLGGLAMHRLKVEAKAKHNLLGEDLARSSGSATETGLDLGAGVSYRVSDAMALNGEVMMRNFDEGDLTSFTGGLSYRM
jgi:opacity protein-like surface antigen